MNPFDAIDATEREVRDADTIVMRRTYPYPPDDVWSALTEPDRLARFFMRPTGDLREGGTFAFEGNAHGDILTCAPPSLLAVTWVYAGLTDGKVTLRLTADGDGTVLELEHWAPKVSELLLNDPDTGMWGLGSGWELGLLGLGMHLSGDFPDVPPEEMGNTLDITKLADAISAAWARAKERLA